MRAISLWLGVVFFLSLAWAAPHFPELSGRIVDNAHILSEQTQRNLDQSLAEYENGTGNQVVVVTIPSLENDTIENYGYQLGRYWGIGQKGKNNGALLIVAPTERKVRIEVGYGLEPLLTDAASSAIVGGIILPAFRSGHMQQGIVDGSQAMLSVLGGKSLPLAQGDNMHSWQAWLILILFLWFFVFARFHPLMLPFMFSGGTSRFGSSGLNSRGWSGGGGFSGGGGSFGGGGASGGW